MEPTLKYFYPHVKAIDKENRRITVCISKDEVDRDNERIEIQAIAEALKGWPPNSVVLGDHQHRLMTGQSSVIGHSPPESFKVLDDEIDVDIVFSTTENAETYWINFRDGHQKAVSIGFIDLEWRQDEEDGRKIFVTTKLELLELSCVSVGSNRGALIKTKGMFDRQAEVEEKNALLQAALDVWQDEMKRLGDKFNELEAAMAKDFDSISENLDDIKSLLITDSDGFAKGLLLGNPDDSPAPAGDEIAEQFLNRMEKTFSF